MKRVIALLMVLALLIPAAALCEEAYPALPLGGPAPYPYVESALSEDGMSYDDGTMSVRVETDTYEGVQVYYVYVTVADSSQLRTATAGNPRAKTRATVPAMAAKNNAVLAVNGDFYSYRSAGVVYRSGERIRFGVEKAMDMLIVDETGDLHIIEAPTKNKIEAFQQEHQIIECFAFGPALVKDGVKLEFRYNEKISCGYPTPDERLIMCQLPDAEGRNQYLFIACDGINAADDTGLSVRQMTDLALAKGVTVAYNLDGGHSTSIYLCGKRINQLPKDREVSDIIYFATLVPTEGR